MDFLRRAVLATIACSWLFLSGCGNTYRPIVSTLPLSTGNPQLADEVAAFNVNPNTNNVADATGSLTIFNVNGDSNVGNYQIGANDKLATVTPPVNPLTSRLITFAGSNSYIAAANTENTLSTQSNTVTLINTQTGSTSTITLPTGFVPSFITATATTAQVLVSLQATTTAPNGSCAGSGAIGIIDTSTAALSETICAGSKPGFILVAESDTEAFILDQTDSNVRVLNLTALSPSSTTSIVGTVGTNPIWATTSVDGNTIYVLNQGSNNISVVDAVGLTVSGLITPTSGLSSPSVIITDRNFSRLYISNTGNNTVSILDASSSTLSELHKPITVGVAPVALSATLDGTSVYVANTGSNAVSVIKASSFNVTTLTPDANATVQSVVVSKDGTKAFIAVTTSNDLANGVYVVLTSNNSFVTNETNLLINIAPPQDLSCDATESCSGVLLQRPVQLVPRI
jgi:YVTN family beta-propeller protein